MAGVQFVVDGEGRRTAAIVPIEVFEAYEEFLIDLGMARAAEENRNDEGRPLEDVLHDIEVAELTRV
jgi:hypothetical protein